MALAFIPMGPVAFPTHSLSMARSTFDHYAQRMVSAAQREVLPDRLRGLALLGIVVVNAPLFGISGGEGLTQESVTGPLNSIAAFLMLAFAQGKFYLLFSFLFGYSASFILRDNTRPNRIRFSRRLLVLAVIGLAHAVFLFIGDILLTYALLGFGLLALSRRSNRALKIWVVVLVVASVVLLTFFIALIALLPQPDPSIIRLDSALAEGTFLQASAARLATIPTVLLFLLFVQGGMAFAAFLLGLLASRRQLLRDPNTSIALWRRMMIIGFAVGLPLQVVAAWLQLVAITNGNHYSPLGALGVILGFATAPLLTAGYIGLVGWGLSRRPRLFSFAEPAGRVSLSVYIGESVMLSLLFCGYGLGFYGRWGAFAVLLAAVATWMALALLASVWLRRFTRGPLEACVAALSGVPRLTRSGAS